MAWLIYLVELVGIRQSCEDTVESSEPLVNEDWSFRFRQRQQRRFVQRHRLHLEEVKILKLIIFLDLKVLTYNNPTFENYIVGKVTLQAINQIIHKNLSEVLLGWSIFSWGW